MSFINQYSQKTEQIIIKEACVNNYSELLTAIQLGANRIELCDNIAQGGTTPSYGTIKMASSYPVVVMIRPRGGNFVYTKEEISIMKYDIEMCKQLNIKEVITGVLNENKTIDVETMKNLISLAAPMKVCFHMAIDECDDYELAIQQLIDLGVERVLTKGGKYKSAIEGKEQIKYYVNKHPQITFLPGGGVTKDNYIELCQYCQIKEVHGTKIV